MSREAERIPVSDAYLRAVGRATYNFSYLEWGIVWLSETLERGFLDKVSRMTAGQIAEHFSRLTSKLEGEDGERLIALARTFTELVVDRNRLMHGNPYTADGGVQQLSYNGKHGRKQWTESDIMDFADKVASASIESGQLLHGGQYENWKSS
ncbi:MAG: hypothetical protein AAFO73_11025 [Pseudomonadota bacterium]